MVCPPFVKARGEWTTTRQLVGKQEAEKCRWSQSLHGSGSSGGSGSKCGWFHVTVLNGWTVVGVAWVVGCLGTLMISRIGRMVEKALWLGRWSQREAVIWMMSVEVHLREGLLQRENANAELSYPLARGRTGEWGTWKRDYGNGGGEDFG